MILIIWHSAKGKIINKKDWWLLGIVYKRKGRGREREEKHKKEKKGMIKWNMGF